MPTRHKCHICHKILTRSTILRDHVRSHEGDKSFKCGTCGKAFVRNGDRKDHEKTHTRQFKYVCQGTYANGTKWGCGAGFHRKHDFDRHGKRKGSEKCFPGLLELEPPQSVDTALILSGSAVADTPSSRHSTELDLLDSMLLPPSTLSMSVPARLSASITGWGDASAIPVPSRSPSGTIFSRSSGDVPQQGPSSSTRELEHSRFFQCRECGPSFSDLDAFLAHMTTHSCFQPLACTVCLSLAQYVGKNPPCCSITSNTNCRTWESTDSSVKVD